MGVTNILDILKQEYKQKMNYIRQVIYLGRPPKKYSDYINGDVLEWIRKCKQSNITDAEIYKKLGISIHKAKEWKADFPQFLNAFKRGQEELLLDMENVLYKRAIGYDVDDTEVTVKKNSKGEVIETTVKKKKKHIWSDGNLQMILRRLSPDKWGEKREESKEDKLNELIEKMDSKL